MKKKKYIRQRLLFTFKLGIGSSLAIFIASQLKLDNTVSAGTIALLTLMATKWETVRLSLYRLITFAICVCIAWAVFLHIDNITIAYGTYVFLTVLITEMLGWRTTISVNAVMGAHLLITHDFSRASIINEFLLVLIGIVLALFLNLFHANRTHLRVMIEDMRKTEEELKEILSHMARYLMDPAEDESHDDVWSQILKLEEDLRGFIEDAREYQENTFRSHPVYYIDYFEMRYDQCQVLQSLHSSMVLIRNVPAQAAVVADYIHYLTDFILEKNNPEKQEKLLEEIFINMKKEEMPKTRQEFESRALLFHILMGLDSFLAYKRAFVDKLDEKQLERYWI
ncbi:MAG: hypothetical protein IJI25_09580 [Eubacterium sp.]|nr:hypothetical protein [Eubacterium sp.]